MNLKLLRSLIRESIKQSLVENDEQDWDLYDLLNEVKHNVMSEFLGAMKKEKPNSDKKKYLQARQEWEVVPFSIFERQWEEFIKWGYVKPNYIKTIETIEEVITKNILKVTVNTELAGHTSSDPKYAWREFLESSIPENKMEKYVEYLDEHFGDFITEPKGQMRISDYGLEPLQKKLFELRKIHTPEKKLAKIDEILSVIHMRSDIASWFIEGGSRALSNLSGIERD